MSNAAKIEGMGAIPRAGGVAFRVWAPHAQRVAVIGSFNGWDDNKHPMQAEEHGYWYTNVAEAHVGDQYKFLLTTAQGEFKRIDPYAREVINSVGNAIVHDPSFDWEGDEFQLAPWNELVIYELHVGTFNDENDNRPGKFTSVSARLYRDLIRLRLNRGGFPSAGTWKIRFNSDWEGYSDAFQDHRSTDVVAESGPYDGFPFHAALSIGPYSVLIFSQ